MASYSSTGETTNYARLCRVVVELVRDIYWEYLIREVPIAGLDGHIAGHVRSNRLRLDSEETAKITPSCTRQGCDTSLLYKILRFCTNVKPTHGWFGVGNQVLPGPGDVTEGDDIERIHQIRNKLYGHVTEARVDNALFQQYWQDAKQICQRADSTLGSHFENALDKLKKEPMDPGKAQEHIKELRNIHLYWTQGKQKMKEFGKRLTNQEQGLKTQDLKLSEEAKKVSEQGQSLFQHEAVLEEHDKMLEDQGKRIDDHEKRLK